MKNFPDLTAVPKNKRRGMTKTETSYFVICEISQMTDGEKVAPVKATELRDAIMKAGFPAEFVDMHLAQIMLKRLAVFTPDTLYDPNMIAFAIVLADRPGAAVLWAWTIYRRTLALGHPYTCEDFANDFPYGPPTPEGAEPVWDAQKKTGKLQPFEMDNWLDEADTWRVNQEEPAHA